MVSCKKASNRNGGLPFLFTLFLLKSLLYLLRLPHHPPYCLPLYIFMQHTGNRLFAVKHQKRVVLLAVNLLCPVLRFLLLVGADGLPRLIELHRVKALRPFPKPGIFGQGSIQLGGIFLFLFFQPFQALLHSGDVFKKFIGGIFLGIGQRRQKQILF